MKFLNGLTPFINTGSLGLLDPIFFETDQPEAEITIYLELFH